MNGDNDPAWPARRRGATRYRLRVPAEYQGSSQGHGHTGDVSRSGVRVENSSVALEVGSSITLRLSFFPGSFAIPLDATVVRLTDDGFAARFVRLGARQEELLRIALPQGPSPSVV